jgi:hypothetical protein
MISKRFRKILYGPMLYETVRAFFAVDIHGKVNNLYKYCACLIQPLVAPWDSFENQRLINGLIADTKWQMGQLKNVLNYLFDPTNNSIYIDQITISVPSVTGFQYPAIQQVGGFGGLAVQVRGFNDRSAQTPVIIHVPDYVNLGQITAIINQIIIQGILYEINIFTPIS